VALAGVELVPTKTCVFFLCNKTGNERIT